MKLNDEEQAMLAGEMGETLRWAIDHQRQVGTFFDAPDMVPVTQAHIMGDPESLGAAGVDFVEQLAARSNCVRIPTITYPRGIYFAHSDRIGHSPAMQQLERRIIGGLEKLGVLMTNTCINYQTILPPLRGEHIAMGDTGEPDLLQ